MFCVGRAKLKYHLYCMEHLPCSSDRAVNLVYRFEGLIDRVRLCWKDAKRSAYTRTSNTKVLYLVVEVSPLSRELVRLNASRVMMH
jgi:hypothetical protein